MLYGQPGTACISRSPAARKDSGSEVNLDYGRQNNFHDEGACRDGELVQNFGLHVSCITVRTKVSPRVMSGIGEKIIP